MNLKQPYKKMCFLKYFNFIGNKVLQNVILLII
ncbi:hypothetical protein QE417_002961 [Mucilaginibacter terrae]|uniref:Uncharacterized protein n=1 Tax=Mucilaginibacter terrae TaxID=1955052 RepID=A0ABU3GVU2_9SPHI|nr:hypothetical protein [Mucilaginibacter terrae]